MSKFTILPQKTKSQASDLAECARVLQNSADRVLGISNSLYMLGSSSGNIQRALRNASAQISNERLKASNMNTKLISIVTAYENTENRICGNVSGIAAVSPSETGTSNVPSNAPSNVPSNDTTGGIFDNLVDWFNNIPKEDLPIYLMIGSMPGIGWFQAAGLAMLPEGPREYIMDAFKQIVYGDFEEDSNLLGTIGSVAVGCIPVVGQIADVRDLVADIYNLIDDGPTVEEWVSFGFTAVGFLPLVGDALKHGDEAGGVLKKLFKNSDGAAKKLAKYMKKGDEVVSGVGKQIDKFKDWAKKGIDGLIDSNKVTKAVKNGMDGLTKLVKESKPNKWLDGLPKINFKDGSELSAKKIIGGTIGEYVDNVKEGLNIDEETLVSNVIHWVKDTAPENKYGDGLMSKLNQFQQWVTGEPAPAPAGT